MRWSSRVARLAGRAAYCGCAAGLLASLVLAAVEIPVVEAGTVSRGGTVAAALPLDAWRGDLPRARSVRAVEAVGVPRGAPLGAGRDTRWIASFDPATDEITVVGNPSARTLAHEYGHALLYDLIEERVGSGSRSLAAFIALSRPTGPEVTSGVPDWLGEVYREYVGEPRTIYGSPYYTGTFSEYFAESFASAVEGDRSDLPPAMRRFLDRVEDEHREVHGARGTPPGYGAR